MRNADLIKYVEIISAIRAREGEIDELKKRAQKLEGSLVSNMVNAGIQRTTVDGHTVWVDRKLWASAGGETALLVEALKAAGCGDLVKESYNATALSSWVREHDPEKSTPPEEVIQRLPETVRPHIKVSEVIKLQVKKG